MRVVHKFQVPVQDILSVEMPVGAKLLHFGAGGSQPGLHLWALVDPAAMTETRRFYIFGTGHAIYEDDGNLLFVGTAVDPAAPYLVWHLFEEHPWDYGNQGGILDA